MWTHKFMIVVLCAVLYSFASVAASDVNWPDWDNDTPIPHTIFGKPRYNKDDPNHNIVREYGAFTVYYDDLVLSPRWTAIKMTHYVADENSDFKRLKKFKADSKLKQKGYKVTYHKDYNNPVGVRKWNRGHMVQFDDARGYGDQAGKDSFYTSNICPQLAAHNQKGWLTLEGKCTEFARDYEVVWIYTGPIYGENKVPFAEGCKVPAPIAFYKIIVSPRDSNGVDVLAFRMPHQPIPKNVNLSEYLASVRDIENETGLDFLHELPDDVENMIETTVWEIWPDLAANNAGNTASGQNAEDNNPGPSTSNQGMMVLSSLMFLVGFASAVAAVISAYAAQRSAKASETTAKATTSRQMICLSSPEITQRFDTNLAIPHGQEIFVSFLNSGREMVAISFSSATTEPADAFCVEASNFAVFLGGQKLFDVPGPSAPVIPGCTVRTKLNITFNHNFGKTFESCKGTLFFPVTPALDDGKDQMAVVLGFSVAGGASQ